MGASGAHTSLDTVVAETEGQMRACEEAIVEIELQPGEAYTGADIECKAVINPAGKKAQARLKPPG